MATIAINTQVPVFGDARSISNVLRRTKPAAIDTNAHLDDEVLKRITDSKESKDPKTLTHLLLTDCHTDVLSNLVERNILSTNQLNFVALKINVLAKRNDPQIYKAVAYKLLESPKRDEKTLNILSNYPDRDVQKRIVKMRPEPELGPFATAEHYMYFQRRAAINSFG